MDLVKEDVQGVGAAEEDARNTVSWRQMIRCGSIMISIRIVLQALTLAKHFFLNSIVSPFLPNYQNSQFALISQLAWQQNS